MQGFLRAAEVMRIIGVSRTTLWRMEREGKFPKRRSISGAAVGWREDEVQEWIDSRRTVEEEDGQ